MLWLKSFHVVFVISWMGSLLYLFQLFAYHNKENVMIVQQRFQMMERRLHYRVAWPSCLLALATGIAMVTKEPIVLHQGWFHAKLLFVILLVSLQFFAGRVRRILIKDPYFYSQRFFKTLHHVSNLCLILIVLAAVLKF